MKPLVPEEMTVDPCWASFCGCFGMPLWHGILTAPAWQPFTSLAWGWAVARDRHTITTDLWLTGATAVTHVSRGDGFLGCPRDARRWQLWGTVIRRAAHVGPQDEGLRGIVDEAPKHKAGRQLDGSDRSRYGAGSARPEDRTLRGVHGVFGPRPLPLTRGPGHRLRVPVGFALSRTPEHAPTRHVPSRSRRQFARALLDGAATQWPGRPSRTVADGGYAPQASVRHWPDAVQAVGRVPISAQRDALPPKPTHKRRGAPRTHGHRLGSPTTWATTATGWAPQPSGAGAAVHAWWGLWHAVVPGRLRQVVVRRREATRGPKTPGPRTPPPPVEAFVTTELSLSPEALLSADRDRWAGASDRRDAHAFEGLGHEQCRQRHRISGANTCRVVLAAARTRWFRDQVARRTGVNRCRSRPWYRPQVAPSPRDVLWACREALHAAGIFPLPRVAPDLAATHEEPDHALPLAA
jgi:hypothetical protein